MAIILASKPYTPNREERLKPAQPNAASLRQAREQYTLLMKEREARLDQRRAAAKAEQKRIPSISNASVPGYTSSPTETYPSSDLAGQRYDEESNQYLPQSTPNDPKASDSVDSIGRWHNLCVLSTTDSMEGANLEKDQGPNGTVDFFKAIKTVKHVFAFKKRIKSRQDARTKT
jgi:hypothetical protein